MQGWMYIVLLFVVVTYQGKSQSLEKDILLIQNTNSHSSISPTTRTSPAFYQRNIQTQLGKSCNYEMKCGEFTKGVFKEFGPIKGFFLAVDRSGRCTHISTMETLPNKLNSDGKIIEGPKDYRLLQ